MTIYISKKDEPRYETFQEPVAEGWRMNGGVEARQTTGFSYLMSKSIARCSVRRSVHIRITLAFLSYSLSGLNERLFHRRNPPPSSKGCAIAKDLSSSFPQNLRVHRAQIPSWTSAHLYVAKSACSPTSRATYNIFVMVMDLLRESAEENLTASYVALRFMT